VTRWIWSALCLMGTAFAVQARADVAQDARQTISEAPERIRVGGGFQLGSITTYEKVAFGEPYLGVVLFGEWRLAFLGVSGEGTLSRLLGDDVYVAEQDTTFHLPDLWLFNVGFVARAYPVEWLYAGGGVAVFSSSDSIQDDIHPVLAAGVILGPLDLGARYKPSGTELLEFRFMFTARKE